ncbi:hypothetical protein COT20_02455 [bacterium (Candidatus Gribaldobacteria) CG08_land_8_20_14_0_20_39_15]|uniref:Homing endonuclease LAGLIDADG domain-containing protein n=1 Tax=bacterium (Candidatus Gribaldobacteria) CG08_land_8_20_14_0_20_39_15 TaxID=2014273 RepID=A0A2M6XU26_9BACT|nr:MAG: hypothetical protein COT20_02455 [bacterium (Candidatus Gribaldobacteria) CG08_land_8_20_14_0_20_39_15]
MRSKEVENYKLTLKLNPRQKEILVGVLLGDGHLERLYTPTLARLKIEHSLKQKDYVHWLYQEFKNWVRSEPKIKQVKIFGKIYFNYGFCTHGHRLLGNFHTKFYKNKIKIVPCDISDLLTPLNLAVWFMDDGSIKSNRHKGIFLNTQSFSTEDVERLQKALKEKFFIESTTRRDKNGKQIYLGGINGEKLIRLIRPHIISSMFYKIPKVLI